MTILITGAAGRTSSFVISALLSSKAPIPRLRFLVRSEKSIEKVVSQFPQVSRSSFVIGDYLEASTLPPALQGVHTVFHNGPGFHSQESAMGIALIDAAREAGVKHFVYCSVLHPLLTKLLNHKVKLAVEEYLIESGLDYTILEPSAFMQNINLESTISKGLLSAPYNPKTLQGFLDLQDLGEIARLVLLDPTTHNRARYELVGENVSLEDVASKIENYVGAGPIKCELVPRSQFVTLAAVPTVPQGAYGADGLERMLFYYDRRGIPGNNNTVRWLLGREPTNWDALIRRDIQY